MELMKPVLEYTQCGLGPKSGCWKIGFRYMSLKIFELYIMNEAHKQYSLLDTICTCGYIRAFGAPGKYLYVSPLNLLHVGPGLPIF